MRPFRRTVTGDEQLDQRHNDLERRSPTTLSVAIPRLTAPVLYLQASRPGPLAISTKGQREPSGLIKTSQLMRLRLETRIIYSEILS